MNIEILAVGRMKDSAQRELFDSYLRRMEWNVSVKELESKHKDPQKIQKDESEQLEKALKKEAFKIMLDERGKSFKSRAFAQKFQNLQNEGHPHIQFILGGADGLTDTIRQKSDLLLSFGQQTWPHMLARIMLLEQIYRSQQILKNHPYHRD